MFVFAYLLGAAWLVLSPACVWALFARGHGRLFRAAAVATLAGLEGATIVLGDLGQAPVVNVAHAPISAPSEPVVCPVALPQPQSIRLRRTGARLTELTIYWPASAHECATAAVLVRPHGRRLRIWLHEGALGGHHEGVATRPVRVTGDTAALALRLPLRHPYLPVDGRTGKPIPLTRT